jgi:hypothetical protein
MRKCKEEGRVVSGRGEERWEEEEEEEEEEDKTGRRSTQPESIRVPACRKYTG